MVAETHSSPSPLLGIPPAASPSRPPDTSYHLDRSKYSELIYKNPEMLPFRYVFVLTNRCNLRCSFCFQEKGALAGSLTKDDWLNVVKQLPEYAHVTLTGGEPLLAKGFQEIFLTITERFGCNIISNGLLLNEELIELFLSRKNFKVLSISVDNVDNTIRDVSAEKWRRTREMLARFKQRRTELGASTVLDTKTVILDENAADLLKIHRYCIEELGADTHSFMFLKGSPIQHADYMFPLPAMFGAAKAHQYKDFPLILDQMEQVRQYNLANGKKCFTHPKTIDLNSVDPVATHDFSYLNFADHKKELFHACRSPWESVHINVDGNLFPCMAISMGNVKTTPLKEIVFGPVFKEFKDNIRKEGTVAACNRCGYLRPCKGPHA